MNSLKISNKKFKYNFIKKIKVKNPTVKDAAKIISLIKEEYGEDYPEQQYYNIENIKNIIYDAIKEKSIIWKCAFLNDNLIGQVMFEITDSIGFVELTIIHKNFRHSKLLSLLGFHLVKEIKKITGNDLKYIYAIIDKDNSYIINFISKYKFIKLATTPMWEVNRHFIIFGRKSFNLKDNWRQIDLDFDLFKEVYYLNKKLNLKIQIQAHSLLNHTIEKKKSISLRIKKNRDIFPKKISIFLSKNDKREVICAEITENKFFKSWYDFRFMNNFTYYIKIQIINFILELFENSRIINSFSLIINAKDYNIQNYLIKSGLKYFGFLPYYLEGKDAILMGISKIIQVI